MLLLIEKLDDHAEKLLRAGASNEELLVGMADQMSDFKALLDCRFGGEMETIGRNYPGFYAYASLLNDIAAGIADGSIKMPR